MAGMKLETAVKTVALERVLPYPMRVQARESIPPGSRVPFDLKLRMLGEVTHEEGNSEPPVRTLLCPAVVAAAAAELKIPPGQLAGALQSAAMRYIVNGKFLAQEIVDEDDPHLEAIQAVDEELIPSLKERPRNGALRANGKVTWYQGSVIGEGATLRTVVKPGKPRTRKKAPTRRRSR